MNPFNYQSDFVTRDPSFNFEAESGIVLNNQENLYIRFKNWIQPEQIAGLKVLDLGSRVSAAGGYVLGNGAIEYLGIEADAELVNIARENLKKYYPNSKSSVILDTAESFVEYNTNEFDIAFVGRVIHKINDGVRFLKQLSKTAKIIIIEDVHPLNLITNFLISNKNIDDKDILFELEYNYPTIEMHPVSAVQYINNYPFGRSNIVINDSELNTMYSIGYLKRLFQSLGFIEDLSPYEYMKELFPEEYGYGFYKNNNGIKKFVIRFVKNV
jgi:hypothetical protein